MRKVRTVTVIVMILLLAVSSIACVVNKTPLTTSEFYSKAKSAGCEKVTLEMDDTLSSIIKDSAFVYKTPQSNNELVMICEFYVANDTNSAKRIFNGTKDPLEANVKADKAYVYTEGHAGNYEFFKIQNNDAYYYLSMVGDTVLYIRANSELASDADALVKDLGY